jgi:hypothetical protein
MGLDITISTPSRSEDFRKMNWLIPVVEELIGRDVENCVDYTLDSSHLQKIVDRINDVLADHSLASEKLPTLGGFFFGNTDYNQWYFEQLEDARDRLMQMIEDMGDDTATFWCWW